MRVNFLSLFSILFFSIFVFQICYSQQSNPKKRRSEVGLANINKGDFYAKITYGRAHMKYEASYPFGYNVPWRKLWRTGDDDATELTITKNVKIGDQILEAGTYALFTIPDTAEWTIIFNDIPGQWGLYKYNPSHDVLRTKVPVYKAPGQFRTLTLFFEESKLGVDLFIVWDKTSIRIPMEFIP
ncbi:DUF2911 domain-containing protein [Flexithrix dorotheae]|uniref:DUF2911 domain-containing protein n=1 Tax=Flexithrix dorotheae TaxID=70993 RepID=UPI00037A4772|nr:DUF2911 domain-containing protein [Flexithrix dorotheae]